MKRYTVEFTASVTGSFGGLDDGQPYRTSKTGDDRIKMLQFFRKRVDEKSRQYGWEQPKFYEVIATEVSVERVLDELAIFEYTKNDGAGI